MPALGGETIRLRGAFAERSDEVDDPHADVAGITEAESFGRVDSHQVVEVCAVG